MRGVGGEMLELGGSGGITRGYAEVGGNLACLENGGAGGREKLGDRVVFALGEFKSAT